MGWEAWLTLLVVTGCFAMMAFTWISPDIIMSAGLTLLLVTGVLLDRTYDRSLPRYFVTAVFYPLIYWIVMAVITVITAPLGLNVNRQKRKYTLWKPIRE